MLQHHEKPETSPVQPVAPRGRSHLRHPLYRTQVPRDHSEDRGRR